MGTMQVLDEAWILDCEDTVTPANPIDAMYHDPATPVETGDVLYVFATETGRVTKAASSSGEFAEWQIGTRTVLYADQTGRRMGEYVVAGIVHADGTQTGTLPNRPVKHYVFK